MKYNQLIVIGLMLSIHISLIGQNPLTKDSTLQFRFNVEMSAVTTEYPFPKRIHIDPKIARQRTQYPFQSFYTGRLTDEPNDHGAIYSMLSMKTVFKKNYELYSNLLMEYRGMSYGNRDLKNAVAFPLLFGRMRDSFSIRDKKLIVTAKVGDIFQFRLNQGLQIYNIDVQGLVIDFNYGKFHFGAYHLPDVSKSIGLGMEELFSFNFGVSPNRQRINLSVEFQSNDPFTFPFSSRLLPNQYYTHFSTDYCYQWNSTNRIYAQAGYRNFNSRWSTDNAALLLGVSLGNNSNRINWALNAEFRYYSAQYNLGYFDPATRFRDTRDSNHYANTLGRHLYPLRNFFYHFNQWAVFTEYQNEDITGVCLQSDMKYSFTNKLGVNISLEYLGTSSNSEIFHYLFYTCSLHYYLADSISLTVSATNKALNLDAHYTTFYNLHYPAIYFALRKPLNQFW